MSRPLPFFLLLCALWACEKTEVPQRESTRLKSYRYVHSEADKIEVYTGTYIYNDANHLVAEKQNDTTYLLSSNQIIPVKTTISYSYDKEGYLIKKIQDALSIRLTATTTTTYEYRNGLLSIENQGNNVREYRYDNAGRLLTTIFFSLSSGNKTVVNYDDEVPEQLVKISDGYIFTQENEKTYLDQNLLLKRYEKFQDGKLVFEQDYTLEKNGLPQSALPKFKGFPKIKAFDYRKGIEKLIVTYKTINGERILSDKKMLTNSFNSDGFLVKNIGYEHINQETTKPLYRNLSFEYFYEKY